MPLSKSLSVTVGAVFVYGTLKRGQCRESMWPSRPTAVCEAFVFGSLFGRQDYPALIGGHDRVLGECWQFDTAEMPTVLETLDRIEGTNQAGEADLYHRVIVDVFDLRGNAFGEAYTYRYASDPLADGFVLMQTSGEESYVAWPAGT